MAKLIYSPITSLDGYVEDSDGVFDWARPDEEVHGLVNELMRSIGTHLYGRRMYETMRSWETVPTEGGSPTTREFAEIWKAADKIVYSTTLDQVSTERTRIERRFDPARVRSLKEGADRDMAVGGAGLAAQAMRAGLVDELHRFLNPVVVGGGKPSLPPDVTLDLELLEERRCANGVVHLRYRVRAS